MFVKISFDYYPTDPDEGHSTGMSSEEFDRVFDHLMEIGANNISVEKVEEED